MMTDVTSYLLPINDEAVELCAKTFWASLPGRRDWDNMPPGIQTEWVDAARSALEELSRKRFIP